MNISVIGTGYVGLVVGACLAETGNNVRCADIDEGKIARLRQGEIPIYEPGLDPIVARNLREQRLSFTTDMPEAIAFSEVVFIAVGTPPGEDGSADLRHVLEVASLVGRHMARETVVVTKSTVPVGSAAKVAKAVGGEAKFPFHICSNPEFLKEGDAVKDFMRPDRAEVGLHCQGARINGRIASLARELKNSETVEIITSPSAKPSRDWLAHVRTGRARHKIRQRLRIEEHTTSIKLGREILDREIKRRRLTKPEDAELLKVARSLHLMDVNHLVASIGQGDVNVSQVLKELYPDVDGAPEAAKSGPLDWLVDKVRGTTKGVRIQGVDGMMVRYAQCCQPVPGDPVVGYVTRGRGVSIHRSDCPNLLMLIQEPERRLEIDWKELEGEKFMVRLALEATDRRGLYADLATAVSSTGTDIRSFELHSSDGHVIGELAVEVGNLAHLQKIIKAARRVKGVTEVARRERLSSDIKNDQGGI